MVGYGLSEGASQGAELVSATQIAGGGSGTNSAPGDDDNLWKGPKTIDELRRMFDDFRASNDTNRRQGLIDYDYYDAKQLTPEEVEKLRARGQPDIVNNRVKVAVNGVLGVIARTHTDPKAWPRSPTENNSASVATDCLRYVTERARFNRLKVEASKDNFVGGCCAVLVGASKDANIPLTAIRWEEFFYDPRSRRTDFLDARYMGIAKWMYCDDVERMYKTTGKDIQSRITGAVGGITSIDETFMDRPINQGWLDVRNSRLMVVEIYYRYGDRWAKCVFWFGGVLEEGDSPYKNEKGIPICPIIAEGCYVDRDNMRYGMVREMRDMQDEINKRRSKLLHLVNSSQIQAKDPSAIEVDADVARAEAARPDGVLPYGWQKVPTQDMAQGQMQLLSEAKSEMERFGPNPAVLGRQGSDTSGRALLARQQAGLVELAVVLDQMEDWELRVYREIWCRVKQFWTGPMFVRVAHDPDAPQFIRINEPKPHPNAGQPVMQQGPNGPQPVVQDGQPVVYPDTLGYNNHVAEMDVDIVIDTTPATATIMQEQLKDLMDLVSSNPSYAEQVPFEVFLDLMPIPRKQQIISQIKTFRAQQQQAAQQQQQAEAAQAEKLANAKVDDMSSKADLNRARAGETATRSVQGAHDSNRADAQAIHDMQLEREQADNERFKTLIEAAAARTAADGESG